MNATPIRLRMGAAMAAAQLGLAWACVAEPKFDATVITFGGAQTLVQDAQIVYAWREMPTETRGLTTYQLGSLVERGLWALKPQARATWELVSLDSIAAIEFETEIRRVGQTHLHEFFVRRVWLHEHGGKKTEISKGLLAASEPVLWPSQFSPSFPPGSDGKRIDKRSVSVRGRTRLDGADAEFVLLFPPPSDSAIRSVLEKKNDLFPRRIEFRRQPENP